MPKETLKSRTSGAGSLEKVKMMYDMDLDTSAVGASSAADGYQRTDDLDVMSACIEVGIGGMLGGIGGGFLCSMTDADTYLGKAFDTAPENVEYAFRGAGVAAGVGVAAYDLYRKSH